jgi:hypothetical protein
LFGLPDYGAESDDDDDDDDETNDGTAPLDFVTDPGS